MTVWQWALVNNTRALKVNAAIVHLIFPPVPFLLSHVNMCSIKKEAIDPLSSSLTESPSPWKSANQWVEPSRLLISVAHGCHTTCWVLFFAASSESAFWQFGIFLSLKVTSPVCVNNLQPPSWKVPLVRTPNRCVRPDNITFKHHAATKWPNRRIHRSESELELSILWFTLSSWKYSLAGLCKGSVISYSEYFDPLSVCSVEQFEDHI